MPWHADYSHTSDLLLFRDSAPAPAVAGVYQCGPVVNITQLAGNSTALLNSSITKSAGSRRRALRRWAQIALKPASKTLGLHRVFIRGQGLKYVIADSTFKRMQVDAGAC